MARLRAFFAAILVASGMLGAPLAQGEALPEAPASIRLEHLLDLSGVDLLRLLPDLHDHLPLRMPARSLSEPTRPTASHDAPPRAREWHGVDLDLSEAEILYPGDTLLIANSTLRLNGAHLVATVGSSLRIENSTLIGSGSSLVVASGSAVAHAVNARHVSWLFSTLQEDPLEIQASSIEPGDWGIVLDGPYARLTESLVYNATGDAVTARDGAAVTRNTFVASQTALALAGGGTVVRENTFAFNTLGVRWGAGTGHVVTMNNFRDNYRDALYGYASSGSLDVSGNWWQGTPNVDGETFGGAGVTASNFAPAPLPLHDRSSELGWTFRSLRGPLTWNPTWTIEGPVIVRSGQVDVTDVELSLGGFTLGSHAGAELRLRRVLLTGPGTVILRSGDLVEDSSLEHFPQVAIASLGGSPTIRRTSITNAGTAVVHTTRSMADPVAAITIDGLDVSRADVGIMSTRGQVSFRNLQIDRVGLGLLTVQSSAAIVEDARIQSALYGILSIGDSSLRLSRVSIVDAHNALRAVFTGSAVLSDLDVRAAHLGVVFIGTQGTLSRSNIYDVGLYSTFVTDLVVEEAEGQEQTFRGSLTVNSDSFAADPTFGAVTFAPIRRTAPSANSAPDLTLSITVVPLGAVLQWNGDVDLAGPVVVRAGGRLEASDARVFSGEHVIVAAPGASLEIRRSTVQQGRGIAISTSSASIIDSTIDGAMGVAFAVAASQGALVDGSTFRGTEAGIAFWNARGRVERSHFPTSSTLTHSSAGIILIDDVIDPLGPTISRSFFSGTGRGVVCKGNPAAVLVTNAFETPLGIDCTEHNLGNTRGGPDILDARGSWWADPRGPSTPTDPDRGSLVRTEATAVRTESWLAEQPRAAFRPPPGTLLAGESLTFEDASFDLDGGIVSRIWDLGDGTISTLPSPIHVYEEAGTYIVSLQVTDRRGFVSEVETPVRILSSPVAVLALLHENVPVDEILSGVPVSLDGAASSDPDGHVVAYRHRAPPVFDGEWQVEPTHGLVFPAPGIFTLWLDVRDDDGNIATTSRTLRVLNRPPTGAIHGPSSGLRGAALQFSASVIDADGSITSLEWSFSDGATRSGAVVSHTFTILGAHWVALRAIDDQGDQTTLLHEIVVENAPPEADFVVQRLIVRPGDEITFAAIASDPDGEHLEYSWDLGDGTLATGPTVTHIYAQAGDRTVILVVRDGDGGEALVRKTVLVRENLPPIASFDLHVVGDQSFALRDRSSDADGRIVAWSWEAQGQIVSTQPDLMHTFTEPGPNEIRLTVTDDLGASASRTAILDVDDVLTATARSYLVGTNRGMLEISGAWRNGTAVQADFDARVSWKARGDLSLHEWSMKGRLDRAGNARVPLEMRSVSTLPPGEYEIHVQLRTTQGYRGDLELATAETHLHVTTT